MSLLGGVYFAVGLCLVCCWGVVVGVMCFFLVGCWVVCFFCCCWVAGL